MIKKWNRENIQYLLVLRLGRPVFKKSQSQFYCSVNFTIYIFHALSYGLANL